MLGVGRMVVAELRRTANEIEFHFVSKELDAEGSREVMSVRLPIRICAQKVKPMSQPAAAACGLKIASVINKRASQAAPTNAASRQATRR